MKKKSKRMKKLDRLSELPDSLIFSIFGLLPMRTVVKTTILSKRWRNLWTTAPCLNFVDNGIPDQYFITWALMFWRGTKILKFKIEMCYKLDKHITKNIDSWVRFAKDFGVQELYLHLGVRLGLDEDVEQYPVPQYLFSSCPSLKVLSLEGCEVHIHRNVQWNQLKSLTICTGKGLCCADIERVLCGSPQLEDLVLRFHETREHLTIRSTSLKKLSIDKFIVDDYYCADELPVNTRLTICTPNLETFEISNVAYSYCSLDDVSSLTEVSLLFEDCYTSDTVFDLIEESMEQIIPAIQHVENVTLSYWCIRALLELKSKLHLVPRLWDVKFLKLNTWFTCQEDVVCALEIFPKVEMLVLEDVTEQDYVEEDLYSEFRPNLPNLRRVEVIWGQCNSSGIFSLMEILLKYASNLEKMVFEVEEHLYQSDFSIASEKLERMQRSFPGKLIVYL